MSKIVSDHIFIYAPEEKNYEHIYTFLRSADFRSAYKKETKSVNIGLEAVLWVLDQRLQGKKKPDLIYLETSLFPERTRINNKIVDFLCLRINNPDGQKDALLSRVFRSYKHIYTALHESQNTVYFVPEFLQRPNEMRMVFSEHVTNVSPDEPVDERKERKVKHIKEHISDVSKRYEQELNARELDRHKGWTALADPGSDGANTFMARDFLDRQASTEGLRSETGSDLELNVNIFHELFHEAAFPDYPRTFLWCIPIVGAGGKKISFRRVAAEDQDEQQHLIGQGALFVMLAYKDAGVTLNDPENLATEIAKTVSYVLKDYFISYLYTSTREMVDEVINRSLRVAAGAIMSRNISHNIGSHVSPRTRITAIEERLDSFFKSSAQKPVKE